MASTDLTSENTPWRIWSPHDDGRLKSPYNPGSRRTFTRTTGAARGRNTTSKFFLTREQRKTIWRSWTLQISMRDETSESERTMGQYIQQHPERVLKSILRRMSVKSPGGWSQNCILLSLILTEDTQNRYDCSQWYQIPENTRCFLLLNSNPWNIKIFVFDFIIFRF